MTHNATGAEPERRLIAIDVETVERVRAWAKSAREEVDAARSILAAWEEGVDPTDKCPDPDCACAQEVASLHVQVSRLESRLDSTRGELERTRERLREAEQEIAHKLSDPAPEEGRVMGEPDNTTLERVEWWTVDRPDYRCPHCGSDDIGPVLRASAAERAAYWCPNCAREIPAAPQVEVIPVAPLLRRLNEQAKATMDEHRNFRSDYDEGRFDAFEAAEAHIEGRDTDA